MNILNLLKKKVEFLWKRVSLFGIRPDISEELRRNVILSNKFSFTWILLCLAYISGFIFYDLFGAIIVAGIAAVHFMALVVVRKGYYNAARFLSSSIPIVFIFFLAARVYNPHDIHCRIESFKILNIAFFVLPFMVFSNKERFFIISGASISLLSYILFEPVNEMMSRNETFPIYLSYYFEFFNYLVAIFLSGITVIYLKQNDEKARRKIQKLLVNTRKQNIRLEELYEKANESNELKKQFLANTTHEIRTPLNAIHGYANLLLKSDVSEKQRQQLLHIKNSSDNLMVIINDILDVSKIEAGKIDLEEITVDLKQIIISSIDNISFKATEKNIDILYQIDDFVDTNIITDPTRLYQILNNLLSNAVKFTPKNGRVEIIIKSQGVTEQYQWIKFEVKDNGIGIPNEKQDLIFDSFKQADITTTRQYGGTGLGLSIVKGLVELMKGRIFVESQVNVGTTFVLLMPFKHGFNEQIQDHKEEPVVKLYDCHPKNINILLVEDNDINAMLAMDTIELWNSEIKVNRVSNGLEAVKELEKNHYDLVLMDIQMPVMNGYDASFHIRKNLKLNIPIIALNANSSDEEILKCFEFGMNEHITKPFNPNDLFNWIKVFSCYETKKILENGGDFNPRNFVCKRELNAIQSGIDSGDSVKAEQDLKDEVVYDTQIIDISSLSRMYKGKQDKMKKPLKMLFEDITKDLISLKWATNENDVDSIIIFAHTLKSKCRLIGLNIPATYLNQMELSAKNGIILPGTEQMIDEICEIWENAGEEIKQIIN